MRPANRYWNRCQLGESLLHRADIVLALHIQLPVKRLKTANSKRSSTAPRITDSKVHDIKTLLCTNNEGYSGLFIDGPGHSVNE